ncbi:MAG: short-chain dehydrogenase/reductase [Pelosinus sp.]|jgi:NAD(P)-dependent dehydrogenase (short-subunit alcohol dehydrogenase family)|nr:short-chain dehydrogenase/reductase [Pelosinus sp.]
MMNTTYKPVAIVTGAAQGIGKAIAYKLAQQGATIIIADINEPVGNSTVNNMIADGLSALFYKVDVGLADDINAVFYMVKTKYQRLDWIINNAGISFFKPIDEMEISEFDRVIDVNLRSAFLFAKYGAPLLRKSPNAAIVNISSTRAIMSEPHNEAYSTAKAGLLGLTHALANSLGPTIRVNAICPGWIDVGNAGLLQAKDHLQHPAGRVGIPEDIANLTAFLVSRESAFITGQSFVVDGGMTKKMIYEE